MVCKGYYQNPELNREMFTPDGWLKTGDLGFLKNGRLTKTGRAKDIIIINCQNHSCREIETAVEEITRVQASHTVACGIRGAMATTDQLFIVFRPSKSWKSGVDRLYPAISKHMVKKFGIEPVYIVPLVKEGSTETWSGKINRSEIINRFITNGEIDLRKLEGIRSNDFSMEQSSVGESQSCGRVENECVWNTKTNKNVQIDQIGRTAFNVAVWREEETESSSSLFYDLMANIFLDEEMRKSAEGISKVSPSAKYLVNARVKYFDDALSKPLEHGVDQIVLLGAGLDTRAIRLGTDSARFFEVEKEATITYKYQKLPPRLTFLNSVRAYPCTHPTANTTALHYVVALADTKLRNCGYTVSSTFVSCDYTKPGFLLCLLSRGSIVQERLILSGKGIPCICLMKAFIRSYEK